MQGLSERQYAASVGLSRGAIQKAKDAGRLVLHPDGSIDAAASDARRAETTDPTKTSKPPSPKLKPVPEAAVAAVGETLREEGLPSPAAGGGTTFLQAKTANEVLKAQERRIRLQKLKGELVERIHALALVFRLRPRSTFPILCKLCLACRRSQPIAPSSIGRSRLAIAVGVAHLFSRGNYDSTLIASRMTSPAIIPGSSAPRLASG